MKMKNYESKAALVTIFAISIPVLIYNIYLDICCSEKVALTMRTFLSFAFTVTFFILQRMSGKQESKILLETHKQLLETVQKQNELIETLIIERKNSYLIKSKRRRK